MKMKNLLKLQKRSFILMIMFLLFSFSIYAAVPSSFHDVTEIFPGEIKLNDSSAYDNFSFIFIRNYSSTNKPFINITTLNGSGLKMSSTGNYYGPYYLIQAYANNTNEAYAIKGETASNNGSGFVGTSNMGSTESYVLPIGILGEVTSYDGVAVYGLLNNSDSGSEGRGIHVMMFSAYDYGAYGLANASSGLCRGVYGHTDSSSLNAIGVYGETRDSSSSNVQYGVYGRSGDSSDQYGVQGSNAFSGVYGSCTMGGGSGVRGESTSTTSRAVHGYYGSTADTTSSYPVFGESGTQYSYGVHARSDDGNENYGGLVTTGYEEISGLTRDNCILLSQVAGGSSSYPTVPYSCLGSVCELVIAGNYSSSSYTQMDSGFYYQLGASLGRCTWLGTNYDAGSNGNVNGASGSGVRIMRTNNCYLELDGGSDSSATQWVFFSNDGNCACALYVCG